MSGWMSIGNNLLGIGRWTCEPQQKSSSGKMGTPVTGSSSAALRVRWCRTSCMNPGGSLVILEGQ
jgi:hypothetical protein